MTLSAFDIFINIIEVAIVVWLVCHYLTRKPVAKPWVIGVFYIVMLAELMVSNLLMDYDISLFVVASITIMIFALFYTTNHVIEKIVVSWSVMNIISILNMFTLVVVSTAFDRTILEVAMSSGIDKTAAIIVSKVLFFVVSVLLVNFRKTINTTFFTSRWWHFVILTALGMLSLVILVNFLYSHEINYSLLAVAIFLIIALLIFIYYLYINIQIESKQRYEDMLLIKELSYQKKSMDDVLAVNEEMKKYRHDVKHVLMAAIGLTNSNQSKEAVDLLTKYHREIDVVHDYIATGNSALDYVLNTKIAFGTQRGIRFKTLYAAPPITMDIDDLCILIGNALDNAIEHCSGKDKEIHIEFRAANEYISVKVINTIANSVLHDNPKLKTTKQMTSMHGFGVKSMQYITKKYGGEVEFKEEEGKFICTIMFHN